MARDAQLERLVDAAIAVCELDVELVHRRGRGHPHSVPCGRCGVGRGLYTTLFNVLRAQGYVKACAGITLPNPGSVGLHEAVGFRLIGVYRGIGFKLGSWHDVAWYEADVQPEMTNPPNPIALRSVVDTASWRDAISQGLALYRRR